MQNVLKLLLPGLIPSWEFFKAVEPSPRVHWRVLHHLNGAAPAWQEYQPRPNRISLGTVIFRLFWNPRWNEALYLVSLAERLTLDPTAHSTDEIQRHLLAEAVSTGKHPHDAYLQFQLAFVCEEDRGIVQTITHISDPCLIRDIAL